MDYNLYPMADPGDTSQEKPKKRRRRAKKPQNYASQVWDKINASKQGGEPLGSEAIIMGAAEEAVEATDRVEAKDVPDNVEAKIVEGEIKKPKRRRSRKKKAPVVAESPFIDEVAPMPVVDDLPEEMPVEMPVEIPAPLPEVEALPEAEVLPEVEAEEMPVPPLEPAVVEETEPPVEMEPEVMVQPEVAPTPEMTPEPEVTSAPEVSPEPEVIIPESEVIPAPVVVPEATAFDEMEPVSPFEPYAPPQSNAIPINPFSDFDSTPTPAPPESVNPFDFSAPPKDPFEHEHEEPHDQGDHGSDSHEDVPMEAEVVERHEEALPAVNEVNEVADEARPQEVTEFKDEFWHILEQAGITKGLLKGLVVAVVLITLGVLTYVFGWYKIFDFFGDGADEPVTIEETDDSDFEVYDIVSSYIFGLEFNEGQKPVLVAEPIGKYGVTAGLELAFDLGLQSDLEQKIFVADVEVLRKIRNLTEVDIYKLIDNSVDRRATLEDLIFEMETMSEDGRKILNTLNADLQRLDAKYENIAIVRNALEQSFFDSMNELKGSQAYERLNEFIGTSNDATRIKAYYEAEKILAGAYTRYLNLLSPRLLDIKTNKEALIQGIKVFDVPGSDIDAIIDVSS